MFLTLLLPLYVVVVVGLEPARPIIEPVKAIKRHKEMWHDFKLPTLAHRQEILSQGAADFHRDHSTATRQRLALMQQPNLACDEACQNVAAKNITQERAEEMMVYEKVDDNGVKTIVRLPLDEGFVDYINGWATDSEKLLQETNESHNRRKREIFDFDTRFPIHDPLMYEEIPFSAAVVLSTGCSGVLIGPQYVLTAAHCIHNGKKYIDKMKNVKAGFRRDRNLEPGDDVSEAFYWIRATEAFLPYEWTKSGKKGKKLPVEKDYAVIKLKRESDRAYLNVSVGTPENVASGTRLHIPAFDRHDDPTLIYRFCRVADGTQEVMYQDCDSEEAAVGAGVYVRRWDREAKQWARKVVAIYGGQASFYRDHADRKKSNVALRITPLKFAQICFWTTGSYGGCKG